MTKEEYFRKNYPDYCYGDNLLSPYWDLFQYGVEFGERQSEKKITELKTELTKKADTNHSLVEQMSKLEEENASMRARLNAINLLTPKLEKCSKLRKQQLTKAIGIIKRWYETNRSACIEPSQELIEVTEQFLEDIEK